MIREHYQEWHYSLFTEGGAFLGCAWALSSAELVTCAHVVCDRDTNILARRSFYQSDEELFIVSRTTGRENLFLDSSRLELKGPGKSRLPMPVSSGICDPVIGQRFSVFGFPDDKRTLGDFSNYEVGRQLPNGWFQVEIHDQKGAELRGGYSGAPAWDPVINCVIGIVVGVDPHRRRQVAYIAPCSILREQIGSPLNDRFPHFGPTFYGDIVNAGLSGAELRRIQRYLSAAAEIVADGVERYWVYACLGGLSPDRLALDTLQRAVKLDQDEFAVKGAREALSRFPN